MSTIASPRSPRPPSLASSSRRGSASTDNTILSASASTKPASSATDRGSLRRNKAALRDYYGLKAAAAAAAAAADSRDASSTPILDPEQESELDKPGFEPGSYVQHLLSHEGLEGVLRVEARLLSDIRSLDGEKKALVYDNYSKLIAATDTIRSMREKMDPLTPTTSTLTPAIGHIAETAATLAAELKRTAGDGSHSHARAVLKEADQRVQKALVRWVLAAPDRISRFVDEGKMTEAQDDWKRVSGYLDKWQHVKGAADLRKRCEMAIASKVPG